MPVTKIMSIFCAIKELQTSVFNKIRNCGYRNSMTTAFKKIKGYCAYRYIDEIYGASKILWHSVYSKDNLFYMSALM